jgi:pimeloyl-ACP methyl ester carboxylesterase
VATLSWTPTAAGPVLVRALAAATGSAAAVVSAPTTVTVARASGPATVPRTPTATVERVVGAGGQRQWIRCAGSGGPTIVLVAGLTGWSRDWTAQVPAWRRAGRVCVYDRPGLGHSPARVGTRNIDSGVHARELRALLAAAGEHGPYLLVGHSYGGLIVRSFLDRYPGEVAGMLLLEAVPPGMSDLYSGYGHTFAEAGTRIDLDASSRATGYLAPLPGLPLVVVTADHPESWAPTWVGRVWTRENDRAAAASRNSLRLVAVNAGHQLQHDSPRLVVASVELLRTTLRRHHLLPTCDSRWRTVRATCTPRA